MINPLNIYGYSPQTISFSFIAGLICLVLISWSAARLLQLLGDRGPKQDGRISFELAKACEPWGALSAGFTQIGWIRPLQIDVRKLKGGHWGLALVLLVSLSLPFLLGQALHLAAPYLSRRFPGAMPVYVFIVLGEYIRVAGFWTALWNLLPLPPFLMGQLWGRPPAYGWIWRGLVFCGLAYLSVTYRSSFIAFSAWLSL